MTETEKKALALVNEVLTERGLSNDTLVYRTTCSEAEALCRAIEQHEAYKQEVSDAVAAALDCGDVERLRREGILSRFIIAKPDPLVEIVRDFLQIGGKLEDCVEQFRAALAARGLEIRGKQP